jgi:hypothetical protein
MANILKQITISSTSNPPSRELYTVTELQGAVSFDTPTRTDVRVGDTIAFQEIQDYLAGTAVDVTVVVTR